MPSLDATTFDALLQQAQLPPHREAALRAAFAANGPSPEVLGLFEDAVQEAMKADVLGRATDVAEDEAASAAGRVLDALGAPIENQPPEQGAGEG